MRIVESVFLAIGCCFLAYELVGSVATPHWPFVMGAMNIPGVQCAVLAILAGVVILTLFDLRKKGGR